MEQTAQESQPEALSEEAKERRYVKVKKILDSMGCIEQYELRMHVYQAVLKRLSRIIDYKDSRQMYDECKARMEQCEVEGKEEIYQNLLKMKEKASMVDDFYFVKTEAERILDYKDVEEILAWVESQKSELYRKENLCSMLRFSIFMIGVIIIFLYCLYQYGFLKI